MGLACAPWVHHGCAAPQAINTHVWGSVTAVDDDSKLPFDSRKSSATNRSTHRTAGRGEGAGAAPARPFTLRLLSIYYFPTGGLPPGSNRGHHYVAAS